MLANLSTSQLDYLQRNNWAPGISSADCLVPAQAADRVLLQIDSIGRQNKFQTTERISPDNKHRAETALLTGLHQVQSPVIYFVVGDQQGVSVHLGGWVYAGSPANTSRRLATSIHSTLGSLYPSISMRAIAAPQMPCFPEVRLVLGCPSSLAPDREEGSLQIDRLIRAMGTCSGCWGVLVVAEPAPEHFIHALRDTLINEQRAVLSAARQDHADSPLAERYAELLKEAIKNMKMAGLIGGWRVGVYLLGDSAGIASLEAAWLSVYSGAESLPEPLRIWPDDQIAGVTQGVVRDWAGSWALPNSPGPAGPQGMHYRHPFALQTILSSEQASALIQLPRREAPGFQIVHTPDFDVEPPAVHGDPAGLITLGNIKRGANEQPIPYPNRVDDLTRHMFVGGITGSGKTRTLFHLLSQAFERGVPFLVLEPAKHEYRKLLNHAAIREQLQIFTVADETVSPFRLNPFEPASGTAVSTHLDLLRAAFAGSFGMWTPLPQILETCLHELYTDRGWDLAANTNGRLSGAKVPASAWPTLSDLALKVEDVLQRTGYEAQVRDNMRAALLTRINSLRTGSKGAMFDVQRSLPPHTWLQKPTIIELEGLGDDDDKAFVMSLLLMQLVEYRRAQGEGSALHLLVIEEAHRLLSHVPAKAEAEANPKAKAVEAFSHLISELRAYGQGVIIADQSPVKLSGDVIKNTNLKIAQRTVAEEDRRAISAAMAMTDEQARSLAVLATREAVVFGHRDDGPLLVRIGSVSDYAMPSNDDVRERMAPFWNRPDVAGLLAPREILRPLGQIPAHTVREARQIVETPAFRRRFSRMVQSILERTGSLPQTWNEIVQHVRRERPTARDETLTLNCVAAEGSLWWATRRGAQMQWPYEAAEAFSVTLRDLLFAQIDGKNVTSTAQALNRQRDELFRRTRDPYPACSSICGACPGGCLHRHAVADLVRSERFQSQWESALPGSDEGTVVQLQICLQAAAEVMESVDEQENSQDIDNVFDANRRAALCFGQQMSHRNELSPPRENEARVSSLVDLLSRESLENRFHRPAPIDVGEDRALAEVAE